MPSTRETKKEGTFFQQLKRSVLSKTDLSKEQDSAASAYVELANKLSGRSINANQFMRSNSARLIPTIMPRHIGRLCCYYYDPKLRDVLPYFDRFPLVIPISMYKDGFLGLNLHYLPMNRRAVLMDTLYTRVIRGNHLDERRRIMMSYGIVQAVARNRNYVPCVKRYLYTHLRSKIYMIEPEDWNIALFVPTDRWAKANKRRVYQESLEKIRRAR